MTAAQLKPLTINEIAFIIHKSWVPVHPTADPYLKAMFHLKSTMDNYGDDDGKSIVLYFLNNAKTWTGDVARLVKAELRRRCQ